MDMKECSKCLIEKDLTLFNKDLRRKDRHCIYCRDCTKAKSLKWRLENPERSSFLKKRWVDKVDANKMRREKYRNNLDHFRKQKRLDYLKHKETRKESVRNYYYKNKESIMKKMNEYVINRYNRDLDFKLRMVCRNRIFYAIKGKKSKKTEDLLGCTISFLKKYLQDKFIDGMSWDNYGEWHIDHIKPLSKFDLTNEYELKTAFNYTNLQPLWAMDNLKKADKYV